MARLLPRLIISSNRAPQVPLVQSAKKLNVVLVVYAFDTSTLSDVIVQVHQALKGTKVASIAFLLHSSETQMFLCFTDTKVVSQDSLNHDETVKDFLVHMTQTFVNQTSGNARLDFLNACVSGPAAVAISQQLRSLVKMPVDISKDLLSLSAGLGELYFNVKALQEQLLQESSGEDQKLKGYEKIRNVGKGAFGTAVLYKKLEDESLVVIKEINMIELSAVERQMALNEVQVLSRLNHPNIISYYRSFEQDGVLMIEMEYADGGTLAQLLTRQKVAMDELEILTMFTQIVSAIRYMHGHNILHRDLKTANVFLTQDRVIKVGDFGISKVMTTRAQAQTVLGTPYYLSPEMCEGKQYDQKSDIWALGCILYEMACLQKTFEGTNLPALVNKIVKGHFQPIPASYSAAFRRLIHDLLQKEPHLRPTAAQIVEVRIPQVLEQLAKNDRTDWLLDQDSLLLLQNSTNRSSKPERSVLYELTGFQASISLTPVELPPKCKIKEVAVSNTHYIAVTTELIVLTWGEGSRGQLGHGDTPAWQKTPQCVEALRGRSIKIAAAGDGFSVFVSESGMTMTCGDGTFGCLGHGDWQNVSKPKIIEKLLSVDISVVSAGAQHVVALSTQGVMYTWGRGKHGRLGLGHEEDCCVPTVVNLPAQTVLRSTRCGADATMVITSDGALLACGRNHDGQLGLASQGKMNLLGFKSNLESVSTLSKVCGVSGKVADVSLGPTHSTILTDNGQVITMGRNQEGQLGHSSSKAKAPPAAVKTMIDKVVTTAKSGATYTVVGTADQAVYVWGTRNNCPATQRVTTSDESSRYTSLLDASQLHLGDMKELINEPRAILGLYASPQQVAKGETLTLAGLYPHARGLFVLVDTTVPLARRCRDSVQPQSEGGLDKDSEDMDSLGPVPEWIKAEVAQSEAPWAGFHTSNTGRRESDQSSSN